MKENNKTTKHIPQPLLRGIFSVIFSIIAFFAFSFVMLYSTEKSDNSQKIETEQNISDVPYSVPENKNVCLVFEDNDACILQLDFESKRISAVYIDEYKNEKTSYFGFVSDYTIELSKDTVCEIIDRLGAITLQADEGEMRCTGIQVQEMLNNTEDKRQLKKQIILKIFEQICKNGFAKDDLLYIIENSESNLTVIDSFYWHEYLPSLATRISFVN